MLLARQLYPRRLFINRALRQIHRDLFDIVRRCRVVTGFRCRGGRPRLQNFSFVRLLPAIRKSEKVNPRLAERETHPLTMVRCALPDYLTLRHLPPQRFNARMRYTAVMSFVD